MERFIGQRLARRDIAVRLDLLYGSVPRRIHGGLVLADAGASISEITGRVLRVSAAVMPDVDLAAEHAVHPRLEDSDRLLRWAEQPEMLRPYIGEHTWLSTPERAVLEAVDAQQGSMFPLEIAAKAMAWGLAGAPDGIVACADQLGMHRALRMLRGLARAMKDRRTGYVSTPDGMLHPSYDSLAEPSVLTPDDDWAIIDDILRVDPPITLYDDANRVAWVEDPDYTIGCVLT